MDRLGSLSLHSLVPLVAWQVNSDTGDTGQSVLAVVAKLLAGANATNLRVAVVITRVELTPLDYAKTVANS